MPLVGDFASKMVLVVFSQLGSVLEIGRLLSSNCASLKDIDLVLKAMLIAKGGDLLRQFLLGKMGEGIYNTSPWLVLHLEEQLYT